MSLGIAFKGPEGIVLAADSRVTLNAERRQGNEVHFIPATFDNATKLLQVKCQKNVGAVTYGLGALGLQEARTAHSFLPEFEDELTKAKVERLSVEEFATRLSKFFMKQWNASMPKSFSGSPMSFFVGGYDEDAAYGRVIKFNIPFAPDLEEESVGPGNFGLSWGGQLEFTTRLIKGFDPNFLGIVKDHLKLTDEQTSVLENKLETSLSLPIPYQFLPLQDCVDLSIFLIRTTMEIQTWMVGVRGVGGAIDVATITRTEGFVPIQQKKITGERSIS